MVDEIEIKNVGNNGVASEATLQALLKAIEQLAKRSGADPKAAQAKTQDLLNRVNTSGIKIITANSDALADNTKAVDESTSVFKKLSSGIFGLLMNGIGAAFGSLTGLANAFMSGTNKLSDFISQIPIVGQYLGKLTNLLDDTFSQYQSLAMAGASFGQSLTDIRKTAAQTGMSLGDFGNFVRTNSEKLAAMSSNVTRGAKAIATLNKALGGQREELLGMGFTFEQVNEQLLNYAYMTRSRGQIENRDAVEVAARSADYAKSLATLSKLTGEDIQALQDKQTAQNNDLALQLKLNKMAPEQADRMNKLMLEAQAAGPVAVARMKEIIMGFPPMTRETQLFAATMGESEAALNKSFQSAMDMTQQGDKYNATQRRNQAEMLSGMLEGAKNLEGVLAAGSLAGEGVGKEILDMLQASGIDLMKYTKMSTKERTAAIEADIATAEAEGAARDKSVGIMASFMETLAKVREAFEINIVSPILQSLTPALDVLTTYLAEVVDSPGFKLAMGYVLEQLELFKTNLKTFMETFKKDPKQAIDDALAKIANGFNNFWEGPAGQKMRDTISGFFKLLVEELVTGLSDATGGLLFFGAAQRIKGMGEIARTPTGADLPTGGAEFGAAEVLRQLKEIPALNDNFWTAETTSDLGTSLGKEVADAYSKTWAGKANSNVQQGLEMLRQKAASSTASLTPEEIKFIMMAKAAMEQKGLGSFANGTNGFQNFGKGSLAMLHGHEAVIPMNSPEGKLLSGKSDTSTNLHESISNTIATSNQGTSDSINQLNNTMMQMLSILNQTKDLNAKIEKNTKYSGSDLSRGSISRMSQ